MNEVILNLLDFGHTTISLGFLGIVLGFSARLGWEVSDNTIRKHKANKQQSEGSNDD